MSDELHEHELEMVDQLARTIFEREVHLITAVAKLFHETGWDQEHCSNGMDVAYLNAATMLVNKHIDRMRAEESR